MSFDDFMPLVGSGIGTFIMLGGFVLIPIQPIVGWTVAIGGYAFQFGWLLLARKIMRWRAALIHHISCQPTKMGGPEAHTYKAKLILRWVQHPTTLAKIRNYRCPDGHFEPLVYLTFIPLPKLINRVRHPVYNQGGAMPGTVLVHPMQFDLQFMEEEAQIYYRGYSVKVSTVAWAVIDEIMPKSVKALGGQIHNLMPMVNESLLHVPWYYVAISSGTRPNAVRAAEAPERPMMLTGPRGFTSYLCVEKLAGGGYCDKPLGAPGADGWARCPDGHEFYMKGAKA